jgi:GDPmannose 4,6-dehydratase
MTAIIWGAGGQDGRYLTTLLEQQGIHVIGITRNSDPATPITQYDTVAALIRDTTPAYIFHFAADSTTRHDAWPQHLDTISLGSQHLLEAVKAYSPDTKVFLSGSGLQFENTGAPIHETDPFAPTSLYAVSRIHTVYAARYYRSLGIRVYMGYFFNHDSPYRTARHINRKIIDTVQRIAGGSDERLFIGDVTVQKEFGFAGDIVQGVMTLVQQDGVYEAVIGTGKAYPISDWLHICFDRYGLRWQDHTDPVPGFKSEYRILVSNPATLMGLGWQPQTDIYSLAKMMSV